MNKYTIHFHDGTSIENLTMNGTMFVSSTEITKSMFGDNAMKAVTIVEPNGDETVLQDAICDNILHWSEGWLFNIRERTANEKVQKEMSDRLEEIDAALVELAELISEVE